MAAGGPGRHRRRGPRHRHRGRARRRPQGLLTASAAERARRRSAEHAADLAATAADLQRRDHLDSTRAVDPLAQAADAVVLDTTEFGIDEVVARLVALVGERDSHDDVARCDDSFDFDESAFEDADLDAYPSSEDASFGPVPVVAVVGRPNVGKSTLVNRILGRRQAVVEDVPGVTRDRVAYDAQWSGRRFTVVDTGGWEPDARDRAAAIAAQAEIAANTADVILFVVDATVGALDEDEAAVRMLRRTKRAGDPGRQQGGQRPAGARVGRPVVAGARPAVPGLGPARPRLGRPARRDARRPAVAAVGADRATPSAGRAGWRWSASPTSASPPCSTGWPTRSARSSTRWPAPRSTRSTAWCRSAARPGSSSTPPGCAARSSTASGTEYYASLRTAGAIEAAEVAVVLLDAAEPISEQDQRVLTMVTEAGRALVIAFNKWDLVDADRRHYLDKEIDRELKRIPWAIRVNISAKTGRAVDKLAPALRQALDSWEQRVPTGQLNQLLTAVVQATPHPVRGGRAPRVLFATQAGTRPPRFVLFTTGAAGRGLRALRRAQAARGVRLRGQPVHIAVRPRKKRD